MILDVYLTFPNADEIKIGSLEFGDVFTSGRFFATFAYSREWIENVDFFSIDPESLPASLSSIKSENLFPPLSVFQDSLPDEWGRKILIAKYGLRGSMQSLPYLLLKMGEAPLGALSFFEHGTSLIKKSFRAGNVVDVERLMNSAMRFASGDKTVDADMQKLFLNGSSPGGARPKVLTTDGIHHWIAKFSNPSRDNGVDVVGLEFVCMILAKNAGIDVPEVRLEKMPSGNALLVERFDISPKGGRYHMISLQTLCQERPGLYVTSYKEVAEKIRRHSGRPDEDVSRFFRQMCFNAVIGNVDDHLKNFAMLHDGSRYRLTPAFDLVPDVTNRVQHSLSFLYGFTTNGRELIEIGKSWMVDDPVSIVLDVCLSATQINEIALGAGVFETDILSDIKQRAARFLSEIPRVVAKPRK